MKLVCTLACRVQTTRLYGKPLQLLSIKDNISILEYLLDHLAATSEIAETVLAISTGEENTPFITLAKKRGLRYIIGDEQDVLGRLIAAGELAQADIVFRVTSECPYVYMEGLPWCIEEHTKQKASLTAILGLPEGAYFELINLLDLKKSHEEGESRHRSELCTLYINEHPELFKINTLTLGDETLKRPDIRLTVDYPEDLIVVREIYTALKKTHEFISIKECIEFLDNHPQLNALNNWIDSGKGRIW